MWNRIKSLTKVFLKDFYQNFKIFNIESRKINKRSTFFWMVVFIAITVAFISYKLIGFLKTTGYPEIFLNIYFIILTIFLMFQIVLIATNVLLFSKELEYVLPMPISSLELLVAKYAVFLTIVYINELIFGFIPLLMYGLLTSTSLLYYIVMPIILLVFPIFLVTIISFITILLMKLFIIIKNKNIYQSLITIFLLVIVLSFESSVMNQFSDNTVQQQEAQTSNIEEQIETVDEMYAKLGEGFLIINPSVEILSNPNDLGNCLINFGKLIIYNLIGFTLLFAVGRKMYLKNILIGTTEVISNKKSKINEVKEVKAKRISVAYIEREFKELYRNPTFFMQMIFPVILILISVIIIGSVVIPIIDSMIQSDDTIQNALRELTFNSEMVCVILGALQVLFSMSGLSLTAISREGKNAVFLKYVPIDFYKQFLYKNVLQVILNTIISIIVLGSIYFLVSKITLIQILLIFATSIFISLINSFLMLIVDLRRPILNWDSEYIVTKKNENKIFQYVLMIIMILVLLYLANIFKEININIAIIIQLILFAGIFMIINILVKKKSKRLFKNIT